MSSSKFDQFGPFVPFPTPAPIPGAGVFDAPTFSFCVNEDYIPYILGALKVFLKDVTWDSDDPDELGRIESEFNKLMSSWRTCHMQGAWNMIGAIVPCATATTPDSCLDCDGATYNRVDYPDLYAALHSVYRIDADTFKVPDCRERVPVGLGGTKLTMDAKAGEWTHTLGVAEMPTHSHHTWNYDKASVVAAGSTSITGQNVNGSDYPIITGDAGGNGAHNNAQPYIVLRMVIIAK